MQLKAVSLIAVLMGLCLPALPSSQAEASSFCVLRLSNLDSPSGPARSISNDAPFDLESFKKAKDYFRGLLEQKAAINKNQLQTTEDKLAALETTAASYGWDIFHIEKLFQEASPKHQRNFLRLFAEISFDGDISPLKIQKIMVKLYLLANGTSLAKSFSISGIREAQIRRRIELAFLKNNFIDALRDLGLVRNPTLLDKVRLWRARHASFENAAVSSALNLFFISHLGIPVNIPQLDIAPHKAIPQELIEKIKENGFESGYPELRQIYSKKANLQLALDSASKLYAYAMISLSIIMAAEALPMVKFAWASRFTSEQELSALQDKTFSAKKIRAEQFENWREAFHALEGRYPDPEHNLKDKAEWDRVKRNQSRIPDDQLKVKFHVAPID